MNLVKVFLILFLGVFLVSVISPNEENEIFLEKGKNIVLFNSTDSFYVETLVKLNPEIEVVSFFNGEESIGYVNFFNGIGENFIVYSGNQYEIILKENATIVLPS